jgi:mannosyltransferase OCH1-like enzyme
MIPKIFHNIWLGKKQIPEEFITYCNNWKKLHPDWEYKLWTDNDLENIDPYIVDFLDQTLTFSSKSNVLRSYIIYEYGGIYADTDFDWNKSLNTFLTYDAFIPKPTSEFYNSAIFGAVPKHPWLKFMLDILPEYIDKPPPWGPEWFTKSLIDYDRKNLIIVPRKYFYPFLWFESKKPANHFPNSYGVHYWYKSWKKEYADIIDNN